MRGAVFFTCTFSNILNVGKSLTFILTDMWEGVDLMHQVCLYLRAMCVLDVVNQDTSLETVPLMGWVEESLHLNYMNVNVFCRVVFFLRATVVRFRRPFWKSLVFTWVWKLFCICFGLASLPQPISLNVLCHFVIQSVVKPESVVSPLHMFSSVLCCLHVFKVWLVYWIVSVGDYFDIYGFMTLSWKTLYLFMTIFDNNCSNLTLCANFNRMLDLMFQRWNAPLVFLALFLAH